jgi:ABC-type branched-subunit amino acid transport system substrate-binding protein
MISVQNHRPQLSGNKWLLYLWVALIAGACSPKLQPVSAPVKSQTEKPVTQNEIQKPVKAPVKPAVISLILPFGLDHLAPGTSYTDISLKQADIALDYYRGFKLALDSLTSSGYNYKLMLFDAKDKPAQIHSLAYNPQIRASDLIVGPIFPDDIKIFTNVITSPRKPIISPLSPASPATFKNQNLITIMPPLEYHAHAIAKYINDDIKPLKVFILRSGYSDENEFIKPFKSAIDSLSKKHIAVVQLTVIHGQLDQIIPQLSSTGQNVFLVPSTNQAFLMVTLHALDLLAKKYPVTLFGHPSWGKFTFFDTETLQRLKTHISSADNIDYKSAAYINFLRNYRKAYHVEPTDFAIKAFDEGLYFGQLLGTNTDGLRTLDKNNFTGLHNSFGFIKKPGQGWINTHVNILTYSNFELKQVQ